mgnify:FL=1
MKSKAGYWLHSDAQNESFGPFSSEEFAWRYLFGRESSWLDRLQHKNAGWHVVRLMADVDNRPLQVGKDGLRG